MLRGHRLAARFSAAPSRSSTRRSRPTRAPLPGAKVFKDAAERTAAARTALRSSRRTAPSSTCGARGVRPAPRPRRRGPAPGQRTSTRRSAFAQKREAAPWRRASPPSQRWTPKRPRAAQGGARRRAEVPRRQRSAGCRRTSSSSRSRASTRRRARTCEAKSFYQRLVTDYPGLAAPGATRSRSWRRSRGMKRRAIVIVCDGLGVGNGAGRRRRSATRARSTLQHILRDGGPVAPEPHEARPPPHDVRRGAGGPAGAFGRLRPPRRGVGGEGHRRPATGSSWG